jgi:hypothetical protein
MRHLTEQERKVIAHRFGIAVGHALTLKEIGEMMSISRERVRQIECQAKSRLRKLFARKRVVKAPPKEPGERTGRGRICRIWTPARPVPARDGCTRSWTGAACCEQRVPQRSWKSSAAGWEARFSS